MYTVLSIITILVCVFLIIIVLVQNSKGGGLAQNFAGQQQLLGVRKTTDYLEKGTWYSAVILMLLSFVSVKLISSSGPAAVSELDQQLQNMPSTEQAAPAFGTPAATGDQTLELPAAEEAPATETPAE